MATREEGKQLNFICPKDNRQLIASAHDGHLFCPDCGFQLPKPLEEPEVTESGE